ncbi:MAG: zinc metallopeptidase [Dehalococcoidia bacterium]|nr:zinc metallopeptidase [Dehalococcoidia bacterium]
MFFDPLWLVFAGPALLLALYAQLRVSSAYGKYSKVANMRGITGVAAAKSLLTSQGLYDVTVEGTAGRLTDHYDPRSKTLRLSQGVYDSPSVAALGIVAHEVGHAVQDHTGYLPLRLRSGLVPLANLGSTLAFGLFIMGFLFRWAGFLWIGVALFTAAVLFALVTLPVELNASRRARAMLSNTGMVSIQEMDATKAVLSAAALTYVAALLQSVGQLVYFIFSAVGMGGSRDE